VTPLVANAVADRQILRMAVAAFAARLDVFQRCVSRWHVFAAHPAGNHAVHLPGHRFVDFVPGEGKCAHGWQLLSGAICIVNTDGLD
jgi:hypothetical protein